MTDAAATPEQCRANALKCYRLSRTAIDAGTRRTLLDLVVAWRELADLIERQHKKCDQAASLIQGLIKIKP